MNCPYCSAEMELGSIQSGRVLFWEPSLKRRHFERVIPKDEDVILPGADIFSGSFVKAFYCRKCRKIIIDFSDAELE